MRNHRYAAIFNGVCWSLLVKKSRSIFQEVRSRDYGHENDQTDQSLSVSGRGSIAEEALLYSGGSVGWTKEMIMEEAKRYLRGEKEFSEFQDLSLDTEESPELPTGPGESSVVGPSSAESLNKVVTVLNGTFYLYIPKAGLESFSSSKCDVFAPRYGH